MRRPWNGTMPLTLTLPLRLEHRPRVRRERLRRLAVALLALGVILLAAGFWLPARAAFAQQLFNRIGNELTVPIADTARQRGSAEACTK